MVTGDRDLFGAVSDRVAVVELRKGGETAEIGPAEVRERYGVGPALVADFIALRGDPSDGLPGARGIGAKTAAELLLRYGSLEAVLTAAGVPEDAGSREQPGQSGTDGDMRPRTAAALRESAELLRTFKRIATLQLIDIERPPDRPTEFAAGGRVAREMGMNGLANRLEQFAAGAESSQGSATART
jgi:5'-3' exonuclease